MSLAKLFSHWERFWCRVIGHYWCTAATDSSGWCDCVCVACDTRCGGKHGKGERWVHPRFL